MRSPSGARTGGVDFARRSFSWSGSREVIDPTRKEGKFSMPPMKFGLFIPQGWKLDLTEIEDPVEQYEAMTRVAKVADEGGWESIWVYDHFHTVPTVEMETTFECWSISATLARDTKRV